ncbi:MAG: calcium/sodium antiporter [Rickettsiales bacterium]|jgi:cation:H+ antiporter|nr:calcium/sodium antiporter [Rickettsiales bacterium]
MEYIYVVAGLAMLLAGGEFLVSGAGGLARKLGVSAFMVGAVVIGFGTSAPELTTSIVAGIKGSGGIAIGNVVGSNIANIFLILGVASLIRPLKIDRKTFGNDAAFLALSAAAAIAAAAVGRLNFISGCLFLSVVAAYVVLSYKSEKKSDEAEPVRGGALVFVIKTVFGIAAVIIGAKLLVDGSITLARAWGVSEAVIGLSIIAVGTSLPELAASSIAAARGSSGLAVGNVVGSNIFNVFFILGVASVLMPMDIAGMGFDIAVMTAATMTLIGIAYWRGVFSRWTGAAFLAAYAAYMAAIF